MAESDRHDDHRELEERLERFERATARNLRAVRRRIRTLELEVAGLQPGPASHAILTIGAGMASLSIDATDGTATLDYEDDHNDPTPAPADAALVFSSDNEAVATVAVDPANPLVADITPVSIGTANISVTGLGTDTATSTPIADPAPAPVEVIAGPAASGSLVIAG